MSINALLNQVTGPLVPLTPGALIGEAFISPARSDVFSVDQPGLTSIMGMPSGGAAGPTQKGSLSLSPDAQAAGFSFSVNNSVLTLNGKMLLQLDKKGNDIGISRNTHGIDASNARVDFFSIHQESAIPLGENIFWAPAYFDTYVAVTHNGNTHHFAIQPYMQGPETRPCFTYVQPGQVLQGVQNARTALTKKASRVYLHQIVDLNALHPQDTRPFILGTHAYHAQPDQAAQIQNYIATRGVTAHELAFYRDGDRFFIAPTQTGFTYIRRPGPGSHWELVSKREEIRTYPQNTNGGQSVYDRLRVADLPGLRVSRDFKVTAPYRASEHTNIPVVSKDYPDEMSINGTPYVQVFGTPQNPQIVFMRRPFNTQVNLWAVRGDSYEKIDPGAHNFIPGTILALNIGDDLSSQTASFFQVVTSKSGDLQFRLATEDELPLSFKGASARALALAKADNDDAASTQLLGGPVTSKRRTAAPAAIQPAPSDDGGAIIVAATRRAPSRTPRHEESDKTSLQPRKNSRNFLHKLGDLFSALADWVSDLWPW